MRVKEESEKAGLKLSIQKRKIMASDPITSSPHQEDQSGQNEPAITLDIGVGGVLRLRAWISRRLGSEQRFVDRALQITWARGLGRLQGRV